MKNLFNTIAIVSILTLSACKSTPEDPKWASEVNADLNVIEVSHENSQEIQKVQYLARNLMSAKSQQYYRNNMLEEVSEWDMTSVSAGFIGSALLTGNPFSSSGVSTAAGISIALGVLTFFADGSADDISQIWMPSVSKDGEELTVETATYEARVSVDKALVESYKELGMELTCFSMCDVVNAYRIYTAKLSPELILSYQNKGYSYVPKIIQVRAFLYDLKQITNEDVVETLALGFKPGFRSGRYSFILDMQGDVVYDAAGEPIVVEFTDGTGLRSYAGLKPLVKTQLGREIMRKFTSKVAWIYGSDDRKKGRYVSYNGEVYGWSIANSRTFIEEKILD